MKQAFFPLLIVSLFAVSCAGNADKDATTTILSSDTTVVTPQPVVTVSDSVKPLPQQAVPVPVTNAATVNTVPAKAAPARTPASGALNPEHGKPGHRCDIAVGAPLNSAPTNITGVVPTVNATPGNVPQTAAPSKGAVRLNPPHGQPGHDCAVEVGKPLKS